MPGEARRHVTTAALARTRCAGWRPRPGPRVGSARSTGVRHRSDRTQPSHSNRADGPKADGSKLSGGAGPSSAIASQTPWWGEDAQLEAIIPTLLRTGKAAEARELLSARARPDAAITHFYHGVCAGALEGEAAAVDHYERALRQLPHMHAARNNLIRGLMLRGGPHDHAHALDHARLAVQHQPGVAEMHYQLGVVHLQLGELSDAVRAYEATLRLSPAHVGALVNGVHALCAMPPGDEASRRALGRFSAMGVDAGIWIHPMQRPPHCIKTLRSRAWWEPQDFPMVAALEAHADQIRNEMLSLRSGQFSRVGGRSAHDHTLVATGEWREFALFGNGRKIEANCARCPVTTSIIEQARHLSI